MRSEKFGSQLERKSKTWFFTLLNMFTAKGFSETRPFMHLSKHIFRSQQLQKNWSYEAHFFLKMFKI